MSLPPGDTLAVDQSLQTVLALSPNGKTLAYVAKRDGVSRIYLRSLDQPAALSLPGTEGATGPSFSPDGSSVGFLSPDNKLKKVSIKGGAPVTLRGVADPGSVRGWTWLSNDTAVLATSTAGGLVRFSGSESPFPLSQPDSTRGELSHRLPELLPDGHSVLFTLKLRETVSWDDARIALLSLKDGKTRTVLEGGTNPRYLATGHLVYARESSLLATPFDRDRLQVAGSPVTVLEGVLVDQLTGVAHFSASEDGTLAYIPGSREAFEWELLSVARDGTTEALTKSRRPFYGPRFSPDGKHLAVGVGAASDQVWVLDLGRDTLTKLTFEANNSHAAWSPDGRRFVMVRRRDEFKSPRQINIVLNWFNELRHRAPGGRP